MKKGSITVFLALVLVLVLSFLVSLLEGARVCCLQAKTQLITDICMQSVFGNYHKGVWEDYHLLFLDGSWQGEDFSMEKFTEKVMDEVEGNLCRESKHAKGWDLTKLQAVNFEVENYEIATDQGGNVFCGQLVRQIQKEVVSDTLKEITNLQELGDTTAKEQKQQEGKWQQAWDALEEAEQQKDNKEKNEVQSKKDEGSPKRLKNQKMAGGQKAAENQTEVENPMEYVKGIRGSSVLSLVLPDRTQLSGKELIDWSPLEHKKKNQGNQNSRNNITMMDRLWQQYYIQNYFSNYTQKAKKGPDDTALDYEMEYIIAGKASDGKNLEAVVHKLLGIREALNFVAILKDTKKTTLAFEIASAAVGFTGMLPLIKAVQAGILLAWAFVESILDVRSLLAGKKVAFLKQESQWNSDIKNIRKSVESNADASEEEDGLNYTQYLQILLCFLSQKTINYRSMDIIGCNEGVKMDNMLHSVEGTAFYWASPLFWNLNMVNVQGWDVFSMNASTIMTYGKH